MSEEAQPTAGCYISVPTRSQRFWHWAGFRFHLGNDDNEPQDAKGWMQTRSSLHLGWADRFRLLIGGKLNIQHTYHMDVPSPDEIHTRFDWHILPPDGK